MKKCSMLVTICMLVLGSTIIAQEVVKLDPAEEAYNSAIVYRKEHASKNIETQIDMFKNILRDYPDASYKIKFDSNYRLLYSYYMNNDIDNVLLQMDILENMYDESIKDDFILSQYKRALHLSSVKLNKSKRFDDTISLIDRIDIHSIDIDFIYAEALRNLGNIEFSQSKYRELLLKYAFDYINIDTKHTIWKAFEKINPTFISSDDYKTFLQDVIKATRAVEGNAQFLGRVKSELEKLQ